MLGVIRNKTFSSLPRVGLAAIQQRNLTRFIGLPFFVVNQGEVAIVERLGKYNNTSYPGFNIRIPILDQVAHVVNTKEQTVTIHPQIAITHDNVQVNVDSIVFLKIVDPRKSSYGVENSLDAISQLAQAAMRSEIGTMSIDVVIKEREQLNHRIAQSINEATLDAWGIECTRHEIKNVEPGKSVIDSMTQQMVAERKRRATVLESEGARQTEINIAEGKNRAAILVAEADARSITIKAEATANAIKVVAEAIGDNPASYEALSAQIASSYIQAFEKIAKEGNTLILPADVGNPATMVASAMSIMDKLRK